MRGALGRYAFSPPGQSPPEEKENSLGVNDRMLAIVDDEENFRRTRCWKTIGRFTTSMLGVIAPAIVVSVSLDRFVASGKIVFQFHSFANPFTGRDELLPIDVSARD